MGTCSGSSGSWWITRSTPPEMTALDFSVAAALIGMHPGNLLADRDQLAQVGVQTSPLAGSAEGVLVQVRGAGCHHHPGQPFAP